MRYYRLCLAPHHSGPRWLSRIEFHVKVWGDESKTWPAQLQPWCKTCQRIRKRAHQAKMRGRDEPYKPRAPRMSREEARRRKRQRHAEMMEDPEYRQWRREYTREAAAARRRERGAEVRGRYGDASENRTLFDAQEVLEWVDQRGYRPIARSNETVARSMLRMEESGLVELEALDNLLLELDRPDALTLFDPIENATGWVPAPLATRRLCPSPLHAGPRWISWVEFSVREWSDEYKTHPARLQSHCKTCARRKAKSGGIPDEDRV